MHVFSVVLSLKYILGELTWIEYWPTREESRIPEYSVLLTIITELFSKYPGVQ